MISVLEKSDDVSVAQNEVHADVAVIVDDGTKISARKNVDSISLSSSIGLLSDGDGSNEDGDEAESKAEVEGSLNSFAALEAALPLKRGLSNFYDGKSRTFMNLAEIKSGEEIEKEESPLNKRRRLMVAQNSLYKWGSSSSSSLSNFTPTSAEHTHSVGVEQVLKSSASNTSFTSLNSVNKQSIN